MAGDTYRDHNGELHAVAATTLVINLADGTQESIALEQRADKHWWIPTA